MVKAKVFILEKPFDGIPAEEDVRIIEEELPEIKDGEFLAEAVYLSVDPVLRMLANNWKPGQCLLAVQVAKIIESKHPNFPVDKHVVGYFGWRTYTVVSGAASPAWGLPPALIPELGELPMSSVLGPAGRVGNTAYFGFLDICKPQSGETVVVSGAGGAVGSLVGQIAKIKGCSVIGIAGSEEKGRILIEELGFNAFINYKTDDIDTKLTQYAPKGIDCYFDNVGGDISSTVLNHMNTFGRISVCGVISSYNSKNYKVPSVYSLIVSKQLMMEGFIVSRFSDKWDDGIKQNIKWMQEGKLKYKETITEGFENMFQAFLGLFKGNNIGKAVIKV